MVLVHYAEVPEPGINPHHSSDNARFLTTRPPGNSHIFLFDLVQDKLSFMHDTLASFQQASSFSPLICFSVYFFQTFFHSTFTKCMEDNCSLHLSDEKTEGERI